jgi:hypothetical protein
MRADDGDRRGIESVVGDRLAALEVVPDVRPIRRFEHEALQRQVVPARCREHRRDSGGLRAPQPVDLGRPVDDRGRDHEVERLVQQILVDHRRPGQGLLATAEDAIQRP